MWKNFSFCVAKINKIFHRHGDEINKLATWWDYVDRTNISWRLSRRLLCRAGRNFFFFFFFGGLCFIDNFIFLSHLFVPQQSRMTFIRISMLVNSPNLIQWIHDYVWLFKMLSSFEYIYAQSWVERTRRNKKEKHQILFVFKCAAFIYCSVLGRVISGGPKDCFLESELQH